MRHRSCHNVGFAFLIAYPAVITLPGMMDNNYLCRYDLEFFPYLCFHFVHSASAFCAGFFFLCKVIEYFFNRKVVISLAGLAFTFLSGIGNMLDIRLVVFLDGFNLRFVEEGHLFIRHLFARLTILFLGTELELLFVPLNFGFLLLNGLPENMIFSL